MVINFHGELHPAAIKKAVALMTKASFWMIALRAAIVVLILVTVGWLVYSYFSGEPIAASRITRLVVTELILGYFVVQPSIASRQLFKRLSVRDHPVNGTADSVGICYKSDTGDPAFEYPWDSFYHAYKADDLIVLTTADFRTSILPRSLFANEQDWKHFRQYVDSRVAPAR